MPALAGVFTRRPAWMRSAFSCESSKLRRPEESSKTNSHAPKAKMTAVATVKTVASRRRIDISGPRLAEAVSHATHRLDVVASEGAVDLAP